VNWIAGTDVSYWASLICPTSVNGTTPPFSIRSQQRASVFIDFPPNRVGFTRALSDAAVVAGGRAGFSVHVVGGTADPSIPNEILWLRSDDGGVEWRPVGLSTPAPDNEDGLYTDDELNWYHTPPVTAADDGALFRVRACATGPAFDYYPGLPVAQNDCQLSNVARLTVLADAAPTFTSTSGDQTVDAGQAATFSAVVTGIPTPTLQWQFNSARAGFLGDIAGATGSSYQTPPAVMEPVADRYRLVATNRAGTATTPWMSLFVRPPPSPPSIIAQPLPATILRGGSASFTVTASGTSPLAYQWRHDGVAVPGATTPTFDLVAATDADAGNYSVAVSNVAGSVTSDDALLTVLLPTFTVGGTVSGLTGAGLVLQDNGGDPLAISADGSFTFATPVADGSPYAVTVATQPIGQACTVTGGTGVVALVNVTSVVVTCAAGAVPTVVSTTPGSGGAWIPTDDPVVFDFSTAMDPSSLTAATVTLTGPAGPVAGVVTTAGARATFTPGAPLCNPCAFTAAVSTGARALDGTALARPVSLSFSTGKVGLQAAPRLGAAGIHTLAILPDLSAWAWGTNTAGALGSGGADGAVSLQPVQAVGLPALKSIDGAAWYSVALAGDGTVWGWGWGPSIGVATSRPLAAPVEGLTGITAISAGYRHGLALRSDGGVMGWGFEDPFVLAPLTGTYAARQLTGLADIVAVAAGENFSLALRSDGVVLAWGEGTFGQLGDGLASSRATPARVPGLTGVVAIAAESFTGLALRFDATIWGWGHNLEGEAGVGSSAAVQPIPALVVSGAAAIATGNFHALALLADGTVRSWGYNDSGRLGDGTNANRSSPVTVTGLTDVVEVSGGEFHSAARKGDGTVWTWGDNRYAQLGDGTQVERWVPVQVAWPADTTPPTVSSTSPASSATGVPVSSAISATFSEPLDPSTVTAATFNLDQGVTGVVTYLGTTATFTPTSSLAHGTTYTATLTTGIKDAAGNAMAADHSWTLTTQPSGPARPLNDTGVTFGQCYQVGSDILGACDAGSVLAVALQDGQIGRDATLATNGSGDGKLGFGFSAVVGGCVLDNVTGLMWEVKTADAVPGLRDWLKTYSNYSPTYDPGGPFGFATATDATGFMNAVNATTLCGFNDWRLPTPDELLSIVDFGAAPAIDTTWFPNTQQTTPTYWSATPDVYIASNAWSVSFGNGSVLSAPARLPKPVRLVRGAPRDKSFAMTAGSQEVTDQVTGLVWRRCAEGMVFNGLACTGTATGMTHESALAVFGPGPSASSVWRLPNIKELSSIADRRFHDPAVDPAVFPDYQSGGFWSSTPYVTAPGSAEIVDFIDGGVTYLFRSSTASVRLVRDGP
jgi:alpha-tubulin suppressor-like RCC1 family protein